MGEKRALLAEQDAQIRKLMCDGTPDQLKLPFALWSRQAVRQLILDCFGIELRPQGEGKYLVRWGLTPQKPIRRAYEQSPPAGKTWLEETYPDIARRAKGDLKKATVSHLRRLLNSPQRIMCYFQHPKLHDAA
ncbi:winged helix-turn-helix domain-containing protein [Caldichromatium japonicum]|uniref:Winged helix-turn-helix domain-containing protein n=1 Tax=Caldichromatium japonicum TaxID=2699430 RepID=A0A6G7VBQ1_9GAMM|nr:winged helix-turn-helix domain-containing protein [Caldichromatium japonicum]QIK37503.1 winged helix-turn-helix domain-containing protein [Caldichromatium japonicum]